MSNDNQEVLRIFMSKEYGSGTCRWRTETGDWSIKENAVPRLARKMSTLLTIKSKEKQDQMVR